MSENRIAGQEAVALMNERIKELFGDNLDSFCTLDAEMRSINTEEAFVCKPSPFKFPDPQHVAKNIPWVAPETLYEGL